MYCINYDRCRKQYTGETGKILSERFRQQHGYIRNKEPDKTTGAHFNLPGHSMADITGKVFEEIATDDPQIRELRETFYIQKFRTVYNGMKKKT